MDMAIVIGLQEAMKDPKGKNPSDGRRLLVVTTAVLYIAETPWRESGVEKPLGDGQLTNIGCQPTRYQSRDRRIVATAWAIGRTFERTMPTKLGRGMRGTVGHAR